MQELNLVHYTNDVLGLNANLTYLLADWVKFRPNLTALNPGLP
jgi:hypothetical protein